MNKPRSRCHPERGLLFFAQAVGFEPTYHGFGDRCFPVKPRLYVVETLRAPCMQKSIPSYLAIIKCFPTYSSLRAELPPAYGSHPPPASFRPQRQRSLFPLTEQHSPGIRPSASTPGPPSSSWSCHIPSHRIIITDSSATVARPHRLRKLPLRQKPRSTEQEGSLANRRKQRRPLGV